MPLLSNYKNPGEMINTKFMLLATSREGLWGLGLGDMAQGSHPYLACFHCFLQIRSKVLRQVRKMLKVELPERQVLQVHSRILYSGNASLLK